MTKQQHIVNGYLCRCKSQLHHVQVNQEFDKAILHTAERSDMTIRQGSAGPWLALEWQSSSRPVLDHRVLDIQS